LPPNWIMRNPGHSGVVERPKDCRFKFSIERGTVNGE
jgi:hypothetical protein